MVKPTRTQRQVVKSDGGKLDLQSKYSKQSKHSKQNKNSLLKGGVECLQQANLRQ